MWIASILLLMFAGYGYISAFPDRIPLMYGYALTSDALVRKEWIFILPGLSFVGIFFFTLLRIAWRRVLSSSDSILERISLLTFALCSTLLFILCMRVYSLVR
jgi:hypothetical protein